MKNQFLLFATFIVLLFISGCSSEPLEDAIRYGDYQFAEKTEPQKILDTVNPDIPETVVIDIPVQEEPLGKLSYLGGFATPSGKVPICSDGALPTTVLFILLDSQGRVWQRELPVVLLDGKYVSTKNAELPYDEYTITDAILMNNGVAMYSVPKSDEPDFHDYADIVLPITITIDAEDKVFSAKALCYEETELPVDGGFGPGIEVERLQTLVFHVTARKEFIYEEEGVEYIEYDDCLDLVTITIDGYVRVERYLYSSHLRYPVLIPIDYGWMVLRSYEDRDNRTVAVQQIDFMNGLKYDPVVHGPIVFDKCE